MVQNLLKAGYPVTVFNRSKTKKHHELGASAAVSPEDLIRTCDIVITMLSMTQP
jgi:3-hydroxyisobutyrate dehydrogenase-like beta-hydroxyacid dehydrogenase